MASYMPEKSRIALRLQIGTDGEGKAIHRSMSLSNVDGAATATDVEAVVTALGSLLEHPVVRTQKVDTDLVTA
jgi:hypothetical protein